jgi:hypothetical protein
MSKARVNMKLDSDNWIKLQNLAAIQNSSCTAIIDQLIDAYVNEKLPDNYEQRIQEQIYSTLDTAISDHAINRISELVAVKLGFYKADNQPYAIEDTEDTDSTENTENTENTDSTEDTDSTVKKTKKNKKVENEVIAIVKSPDTDSTDNTDKTEAEINIARFQKHRAASNKISRPDSYVASQENLARQTIRRYRKGERKPKQVFVDKWGLNWDGSAWCLN